MSDAAPSATPVRGLIRAVAENAIALVGAGARRLRPAPESPFLLGIHAPMPAELTLTDLAVTGTIPPGLRGRYLKMGANPVRPDHSGHHWFLGDGMVHGIAIRDGAVAWYRNRWIRSRLAAAALGEPEAPGPRRGRNDTVNTNVVDIGGRAFAVVEAGSFPVELSDTLEAQRYNPFEGTLAGSFSGHPHRDPLTGAHHAIAYDGNVWDAVRHVVVSADGEVVRDLPIPVEHGPCIHDCAITARFVVVLDLPVTFSMRAVVGGQRFPYRWRPAHRARGRLALAGQHLGQRGLARTVPADEPDPVSRRHLERRALKQQARASPQFDFACDNHDLAAPEHGRKRTDFSPVMSP